MASIEPASDSPNKHRKRASGFAESFAFVEERKVSIFDFTSQTWNSLLLSSSVQIGLDCRYVWVEEGLFCSGGGEDCKCTLLLTRDWTVIRLADMIASRNNHGLWADLARKSVLTFGGMHHTGYCKFLLQTKAFRPVQPTVREL